MTPISSDAQWVPLSTGTIPSIAVKIPARCAHARQSSTYSRVRSLLTSLSNPKRIAATWGSDIVDKPVMATGDKGERNNQ